MRIALTGGIGSGKNYIATLFEELGFYSIDLDLISKTIYTKNSEVYNHIVEAFSDDNILDAEGEINRKALKDIIFKSDDKRLLLESVAHKYIMAEDRRLANKIKSKDSKAIIITHAALLIDAGFYKGYDLTILIYTDIETQINRVSSRDNLPVDTIKKIINTQMPYEEKLKYADMVIDNNSSDDKDIREEVARVFKLIKLIEHGSKHSDKIV